MRHNQTENSTLEYIDVVILCGGLGKRLRQVVSGRPKPMAEVNGRPFLEILIDSFFRFGCKRFVLCAGYKGDLINQHFRNKYRDREILISTENHPLGTGGALRHARTLILSNPFLVSNGDSLCRIDPSAFLEFHKCKNALVSAAVVRSKTVERFGSVRLDDQGRVMTFDEKKRDRGEGWINAGIYLMNREIFPHMSKFRNGFSLESDLFPKLAGESLYGMKSDDPSFVDIGTPESFLKAERLVKEVLS